MIEPLDMEFDLPMMMKTESGEVHVSDYTVKATIEWDETTSGSDWYVSLVEVLGNLPGKPDKWHRLDEDSEVTRGVRKLAYSLWHDAIQRRWEDHLMDMPRKRRSALRLVQ